MAELGPLLEKGQAATARGTVVMGSVQHDVHDIGKDIVVTMLRGVGFEVVDLGVDVPPEKFVEAIARHKPQVVGMSVLLTTCFKSVIATVEAIKQAGQRQRRVDHGRRGRGQRSVAPERRLRLLRQERRRRGQVRRQRGGSGLMMQNDAIATWSAVVPPGARLRGRSCEPWAWPSRLLAWRCSLRCSPPLRRGPRLGQGDVRPHQLRFRRGRPRGQGRAPLHHREQQRGRHPHRIGQVELRLHHGKTDQAGARRRGRRRRSWSRWTPARSRGGRTPRSTVVFAPPFPAEVQLHVHAFIRGDVVVQPGAAEFGSVSQGAGASRKLKISYAGRNDWQIARIECANPHIEAVRRGNRPHAGTGQLRPVGRISRRTRRRAISGTSWCWSPTTSTPARPACRSPVEGLVVAALSVQPSPLMMGLAEAGQPVTRTLVVQGRAPFHVLAVQEQRRPLPLHAAGGSRHPPPSGGDVSRPGRAGRGRPGGGEAPHRDRPGRRGRRRG